MIELLKHAIKDYGSAIGSVLAFVFGIMTMMIKYRLDKLIDRRRVLKSFKKLKESIKDNPPPKYIFVGEVEPGDFSKTEIDNLTNLSRYYKRLMSIEEIIKVVDKDLINTLDMRKIRQYHNIRWHFNVILDKMNESRTKSFIVDVKLFDEINYLHEDIIKVINSKDEYFQYIQ